jgi:histone-lysine N-methyltransferase SETMAR
VAKRDRFSKKAVLCVWSNFEGVIHFQLVPNSRAIDAELYFVQLDRMYAEFSRKYPALVNSRRVLLQQGNARKTKGKLQELDATELLPHPAYSPDLAPSDFHRFRAMARFLHGRSFKTIGDVEMGCNEMFASKDKAWYSRGIELLAEKIGSDHRIEWPLLRRIIFICCYIDV